LVALLHFCHRRTKMKSWSRSGKKERIGIKYMLAEKKRKGENEARRGRASRPHLIADVLSQIRPPSKACLPLHPSPPPSFPTSSRTTHRHTSPFFANRPVNIDAKLVSGARVPFRHNDDTNHIDAAKPSLALPQRIAACTLPHPITERDYFRQPLSLHNFSRR
jgi:hypothetical protein